MQPVVRVELTMWVTSGQMAVFNGGGCRWASQCSKHHACKHVHDVHDLDHCLSLGAHTMQVMQHRCMHLSDSICLVFD